MCDCSPFCSLDMYAGPGAGRTLTPNMVDFKSLASLVSEVVVVGMRPTVGRAPSSEICSSAGARK